MLEDRLRAHPLVSQCMVVGDGKPFIGALVTVDRRGAARLAASATARPAGDGRRRPASTTPELRAEIGKAVDDANRRCRGPSRSASSGSCPVDFTEAGGEMTPTLKVKRAVVAKNFADDIARHLRRRQQPA